MTEAERIDSERERQRNLGVVEYLDDIEDYEEYEDPDEKRKPGWYFYYAAPGCLPVSPDAFHGPYDTEEEAEQALEEDIEDNLPW